MLCYALTGQCITNRDYNTKSIFFRTEAWKRASTPRWLWSCWWRMRTLIVCWRRMWRRTLWGISRRSSTRWETEGWRPRPLGKDDLHQMDGWRHQIGEKLCSFLITYNFWFFVEKILHQTLVFLDNTCVIFRSSVIYTFRFNAKPKLIFIKCLPVLGFKWLCTSHSWNGILKPLIDDI